MEIAKGIHRVQASLGDRFVCMYLLVGDEATMLIDTGLANMPEDVLLPYMDKAGLDIGKLKYVLISHIDFDHTGGNGPIMQLAPQATLMCHELDRAMIDDVEVMIRERYSCYQADHGIDETEEGKANIREVSKHVSVDLGIKGGEVLHLGGGWRVEVLHTPGHSRGHISVYDSRSQSMLVMDSVLSNSVLTADGQPAFPPTYRYVDTYLSSTQRIDAYDLQLMATSHYPLCEGKGAIAEFLGETRAFVERAEATLRGFLQQSGSPVTMKEIIKGIAPKLGPWSEEASAYLVWPLTGHLERLQLYGLIETGRRDGLMTVRWRG
jgi:glyoxylase-like metal-dependent hydrolase (beta-lactamase superfamily II)